MYVMFVVLERWLGSDTVLPQWYSVTTVAQCYHSNTLLPQCHSVTTLTQCYYYNKGVAWNLLKSDTRDTADLPASAAKRAPPVYAACCLRICLFTPMVELMTVSLYGDKKPRQGG